MKKFKSSVLFVAAMGISVLSMAQKGSISSDLMKEIRSSYNEDASTKGIRNALTNNRSIKKLALNVDKSNVVDHFFKYKVDVKGITNQKSSGRCWMFTSLNTIRPTAMSKFNLNSFDFSHNYLYFFDIFEKSNLFLENIISTSDRTIDDREVVKYFSDPVSDGGVWNSFFNVASKYGVVPNTVMPETAISNNTGELGRILRKKLRKEGYAIRTLAANKASKKELESAKLNALKDVYRILSLTLGQPPLEFSWRYKDAEGTLSELKKYTPQEFLEELVPNFSQQEMVMIMNDPTREYYKVYEIKNYRNVQEGINWKYLNLPNDDLKKSAVKSIKNNEAMYASCDVGKQHNTKAGVMDLNMYDYSALFGVDFSMDKKARILTRQSGSSHAMALVGVDVDKNDKPIKWQFENSWGTTAGHNGYIAFTDQWFSEYMFRVVIKKEYLSKKAQKALKSKTIQLPIWDYMF